MDAACFYDNAPEFPIKLNVYRIAFSCFQLEIPPGNGIPHVKNFHFKSLSDTVRSHVIYRSKKFLFCEENLRLRRLECFLRLRDDQKQNTRIIVIVCLNRVECDKIFRFESFQTLVVFARQNANNNVFLFSVFFFFIFEKKRRLQRESFFEKWKFGKDKTSP